MKNLYLIFTIVFLLFSLAGGVFLVKNNQDNRNRATNEQCTDANRQLCQSLIASGDRCSNIGSKECHWIGGTSKTVTCTQYSPMCANCGINVWIVTNQFQCEVEDNGTPPPSNGSCGWNGSQYNSLPLGGSCFAVRYHCPDMTPGGASQGCNLQGPAYKVYRTSSDGTVKFDPGQCGMQQIDTSGCGCTPYFQSIYYPCTTATPIPTATKTPIPTATKTPIPTATKTPIPTATKTPTKTPIPTNTPTGTLVPTLTPTKTPIPTATKTPTKTPIPTNTPTGTLVPTNTPTKTLTPTKTPIPTNTPTGTLVPTNTPTNTPTATNTPLNTPTITQAPTSTLVPTEVIAEGPSPTRIVLPNSGIEFPSQILTIIGVIVTLAGFLILL